MAYSPSDSALDGKYRKIKVELVAPDGGPPGLYRTEIKRRQVALQISD
jgi:hypothetical protein